MLKSTQDCFLLLALVALSGFPVQAVELFEITPETRPDVGGKEVDWIDGDIVIRNDKVVAVIAAPVGGRDANMTTRDVGGGIIDLTRIDDMSDQLTAFYPTAQQFKFFDPTSVTSGIIDGLAFWQCESIPNENGVRATVRYELRDGDDALTYSAKLNGEDLSGVAFQDGVRADRTFQFATNMNQISGRPDRWVAVFWDEFFRQAYAIEPLQKVDSLSFDNERMRRLTYTLADSTSNGWTARLYPAVSLSDASAMSAGGAPQEFRIDGLMGEHPRATIALIPNGTSVDREASRKVTTYLDGDGRATLHVLPGKYTAVVEAVGHESTEQAIKVDGDSRAFEIGIGAATTVKVTTGDVDGESLPAKLTFYGTGDTSTPDFGPDSADGSVKNCVYTVDGDVVRSIPPGTYDVLISHGPEYDAESRTIEIESGRQVELDVTLNRVVDTTGWVSAELHSHSSPSGDNTSSQLGRVENLVCEHLEFAPCTEHQRIDSYDDQLDALGATERMATCSGIELTGGPLPINHQNAFPLKWRPHEQAGGGPRTDLNPIMQIQRLALWDNNADKVVQINHPDLNQMARDKDKDGVDDEGFAAMFDFTDVIEVHPPQAIFDDPESLSAKDLRDNRMLQWMRVIAEGRRIPGVVNTDAHYNHHGSGWLRTWVKSSTDDPAEISIDEMTESLEAGRAIMSTGPFMTVQLHADELDGPAEIGDEVVLSSSQVELHVQVQCPNWLDVNRVEVFVNGKAVPELSRRRATHRESFGSGVVKFEERLPLEIREDAFIIVAAIGEGQVLGRVMGEEFGQQPPVVVSNPIYVQRK